MSYMSYTLTSSIASLLLCAFALIPPSSHAQDWPQWGGTSARNMYCTATNLPDHFTKGKAGDIKFKGTSEEIERANTENLKWVAKLGSQSYGNVTVANGRVFIGTNNENPRDSKRFGKVIQGCAVNHDPRPANRIN